MIVFLKLMYMYYRDQIEKIMSEAGFSDSEKEEFELKVNDYVLSDKGNQVLYDPKIRKQSQWQSQLQ